MTTQVSNYSTVHYKEPQGLAPTRCFEIWINTAMLPNPKYKSNSLQYGNFFPTNLINYHNFQMSTIISGNAILLIGSQKVRKKSADIAAIWKRHVAINYLQIVVLMGYGIYKAYERGKQILLQCYTIIFSCRAITFVFKTEVELHWQKWNRYNISSLRHWVPQRSHPHKNRYKIENYRYLIDSFLEC